MNIEKMAELLKDKKELVAEIEKHTKHLQNDNLEGGRQFTSYMIEGMIDHEDAYCSVDSVDMENTIDKLLSELPDDTEDSLKAMFEGLRGKGSMRVAFSTTVSKSHVTIRVIQGGEVTTTTSYTNVKSVDDFMKLVSFHTAEFVDPILKDYEVIKGIFGK